MNKLVLIGILAGGFVLGVILYLVLFAVAPAIVPAVVLVPSGSDVVIVPPETVAVVVPAINLTPEEVPKVVFVGITTVSPLDQSTSQSIRNNITVIFTEAMDASTINENTFFVKGPSDIALQGEITSDQTKKIWTFTPASNLLSNTKYDIMVNNAVRGISGNSLHQNFAWSFTTDGIYSSGGFSGGSSGGSSTNYLILTTVTLSPALANLSIGSTTQLTAEGFDRLDRSMAADFNYTTSDANIATVDVNGLVTGISAGEAIITATSGSLSDTSTITVVVPVLTTVTLSSTVTSLTIDSNTQLTAEGFDQLGYAMAADFNYTTSDANIATVDVNGVVTGVSNGEVIITSTSGSLSDTSTITIVVPVLTTVTLLPAIANVDVSETTQLTAEGFDQLGYAMAADFNYTTSDANIATVNASGLVTGVSEGEVIITATSGDLNDTSAINVIVPVLTTVTLLPEIKTIYADQTTQLTAEGFDQIGNPMDVDFNYTTSDANIATVDVNGLVTGVSDGEVIITATSGSLNDTSTITVIQLPSNPTAPTLGETARFVMIASQKITTTGVTAISDGDIVIEDQARTYYEGFTAGILPGEFIELTNGLSYAHDDTDPALIPAPYASTIVFIDQVRTDLGIAYNFLATDPNPGAPTQVCPTELGGLTLTRGVYKIANNVIIQQGDLHLDAQGDPNSVWIFTIDGTLTTGAPGGNVILENGALAKNVYWRVAGTTSIGSNTNFKGNVFNLSQVNVLSGANIVGRLFSVNEQVTLIGNTVTKAS